MAYHALTGAHISLVKVGGGTGEGGKDLLLAHRPLLDEIHSAVVALADHRVHRAQLYALSLTAAHHILHQSIVDQPHI